MKRRRNGEDEEREDLKSFKRHSSVTYYTRLSHVLLPIHVQQDLICYSQNDYIHPAVVLFASLYMATFCFIEPLESCKFLTKIGGDTIQKILQSVIGDYLTKQLCSVTQFSSTLHHFLEYMICNNKLNNTKCIEPVLDVLEQKIDSIGDILHMEECLIDEGPKPPWVYPLFQTVCSSFESILFWTNELAVESRISPVPDEQELQVLSSMKDHVSKFKDINTFPFVDLHHLIVYYLSVGSIIDIHISKTIATFISVPKMKAELTRWLITDCMQVVLQYLGIENHFFVQKMWCHKHASYRLLNVTSSEIEFQRGFFYMDCELNAYITSCNTNTLVQRNNGQYCKYEIYEDGISVWGLHNVVYHPPELEAVCKVTGNGSDLLCYSFSESPRLSLFKLPHFTERKDLTIVEWDSKFDSISAISCTDHYIFVVSNLKIFVFDIKKVMNRETTCESACFIVPLSAASYKFDHHALGGDSVVLMYKNQTVDSECSMVVFSM